MKVKARLIINLKMDWEFDEEQKLTYENPVFEEQCKRRGRNFDELNTGWVEQIYMEESDEDEDEDIEDEDDDNDDDWDSWDDDDDNSFLRPKKPSDPPSKGGFDRPSRPEHPDRPARPDRPNFTPPPKAEKDEISMESLEELFKKDDEKKEINLGTGDGESVKFRFSSKASTADSSSEVSNQDKIFAALDAAERIEEPKLSIDKTALDESGQPVKKKLKFKKKIE